MAATTSMTMMRPTRSPMMVPNRSPAARRSAKPVAESHDFLSAFQPSRIPKMVSHPDVGDRGEGQDRQDDFGDGSGKASIAMNPTMAVVTMT